MSGVLITGAEGFVGPHLLREVADEARPVEVDVTDGGALREAVRQVRPDAVVHLAALSSVAESWDDPASVWRVNALGTVNLLDAVRAGRPEARVLLVSTGEVYGRASQLPTSEDAPVAPLSPYAASKAAAELAGLQELAAGALDVIVARAFPHEGPGRDERFAVGSWVAQVARLEREGGGTLRVGNLDAERDLTDVRDVCAAYRLLLDPGVPAGIYNVASGAKVAMREVLEQLLALSGAPISVEAEAARSRPADLPVVWGDAGKLRAATGWEPKIPLQQTLGDALAAAREPAGETVAR